MNKALFNLPVLTTMAFSLAATVVLVAVIFFKPEPPTLLLDTPWDVPAFQVVDQNGNAVTRESMLGKVWVCDFFLSRCNSICPKLSRTMADLANDLSKDPALDEVMLVSFSLDPEHDTIEELNLYREINRGYWSRGSENRQKDLNRRWMHTRAEEQEPFWELVRDGFKLYVGPSVDDLRTPIAHSGKLVLIDKRGRISGYYEGTTATEIPALIADIRRLADEPMD